MSTDNLLINRVKNFLKNSNYEKKNIIINKLTKLFFTIMPNTFFF